MGDGLTHKGFSQKSTGYDRHLTTTCAMLIIKARVADQSSLVFLRNVDALSPSPC
jgi:hypothetical protein